MRTFRLLVALVSWVLIAHAQAAVPNRFRGGGIYDLSSERKTLLFTMHADLKAPAPEVKVFTSRYVDQDGKEALTEVASFDHLQLRKYVIRQEQLNETYELDVAGGKMHFQVTKGSETKRQEREIPKNLVIGPSLVPFLQQHWSEIQNRETVNAELAVLDRLNTYNFEFVKLRESKSEGHDVVIIRMKPSNIIVSAVVRPSYLVVSADGSRIIEIKGRMLLKRKDGSRWVDFEGDAIFTY